MEQNTTSLESNPFWTWPSRIVGSLMLLGGLLGPIAWLYHRSEQAVPRQRITVEPVSVPLRPKMLHIPAGEFRMGSTKYVNAQPVHFVKITRPFALSETEVTQAHYQAVMGENPSHFKDGHDSALHPVENVSWFDAVRYCNKLSDLEGRQKCYEIKEPNVTWEKGLACEGYRLPTEAEWEYAAGADQSYEYAGSDKVDLVAWYSENAEGKTHPVKIMQANTWFLHDLSGNVWEWVWDRYKNKYAEASSDDPMGPDPSKGGNRVLRGGSYGLVAAYGRVTFRGGSAPSKRDRDFGFRLARSSVSYLAR